MEQWRSGHIARSAIGSKFQKAQGIKESSSLEGQIKIHKARSTHGKQVGNQEKVSYIGP